jgi:squalene cyclase
MKINFSFFRNPDMQMAMADQNTYVPHLLQMYNEGYRPPVKNVPYSIDDLTTCREKNS